MVGHSSRLPCEAQTLRVGADTGKETKKQKSPEAVYARGETWFMTNGHYKSSHKTEYSANFVGIIRRPCGEIFFFKFSLAT